MPIGPFVNLTPMALIMVSALILGVNGEVTPCFIPLPELAFTEFSGILTPSTPMRTHDETVANSSTSRRLATAISNTSDEAQTTSNAEASGHDDESANISTSNACVKTTSKSTSLLTNDGIAYEAADENSSWLSQLGTDELFSEATEAGLGLPATQNSAICVPYCAGLDEWNRCVSIKGCGYPDAGRFGRHGCCPPGYYSESEVVGLISVAVLILGIIWWMCG